MTIEIKSICTGAVLFSGEYASIKSCIEEAVRRGAELRDAGLSGADLSDANLSGAELSGADLSDAVLNDANLHKANLHEANLRGADLSRANLSCALLSGAELCRADLSGADISCALLHGADLRGAYLYDADLRKADLTIIRDDIWAVLSAVPAEADGFLEAINGGLIDGSIYAAERCCLVGALAGNEKPTYLEPNSCRPAERFFLSIAPGDTPRKNQISRLASEWVSQWIELQRSAFAATAE